MITGICFAVVILTFGFFLKREHDAHTRTLAELDEVKQALAVRSKVTRRIIVEARKIGNLTQPSHIRKRCRELVREYEKGWG